MSEGPEVKFGGDAEGALASITQVREALQGLTSPIRGIRENLGELAEAFIAAFAVEKIAEWAHEIAEAGAQVDHFTHTMGMSAEEASKFITGVGALGVSAESASMMINRMSRNLVEASKGTGEQASALRALGLSVKDLTTGDGSMKDMNEILGIFAEKFSGLADGPEKTAIAIALLGRSGAQLIPFLDQGKAGMEKLNNIAERTGTVFSKELAHSMEETSIAMYETGKATEGLSIAMYTRLSPAIDAVIKLYNDSVEGIVKLSHESSLLADVMNSLATAFKILIALLMTAVTLFAELWDSLEFGAKYLGAFASGLNALSKWNFKEAQAGWAQAMKDMKTAGDDFAKRTLDRFNNLQKDVVHLTHPEEAHGGHETEKPKPKGIGDSSRVEEWKQSLQEQLAANEDYFGKLKGMELQYWEDKRKLSNLTVAEERAIDGQIFALKKSMAQEALQSYLSDLNYRQKIARDDYGVVLGLETEKLNEIKSKYGERSKEYQAALQEMEEMERQHQNMVNRIQLDANNTRRAIAKGDIDLARTNLDLEVEYGRITSQQKIAELKNLQQREYQAEVDALQDKKALGDLTIEAATEIDHQLLALKSKHANDVKRLEIQSAHETLQQWKSILQPLGQAFDDMIRGIAQGTQTFHTAWKHALGNILLEFIGARIQLEVGWLATQAAMALGAQVWANKSLLAWLASILGIKVAEAAADGEKITQTAATETAITDAHATGVGERLFTDVAALAVTTIASHAAAASAAQGWAADYAVAAMASVAAIPYFGWLLAPGVGEAAYTDGQRYAGLASLDVGAWEVPQDMTAKIHKGESVVPTTFAEGLRANGGAGTGGGSTTIQINTIDAEGVKKFIKKNYVAVAAAGNKAKRNFVSSGRQVRV